MKKTKHKQEKLKPSPPLPPPPKPPVPPSRVYRLLNILGGMLGHTRRIVSPLLLWASVCMTLTAGIFYFLPRITIDPSGPYDPANPSPITFAISNTNIVPLRDVQIATGLCYIVSEEKLRPPECNGPAKTKFINTNWNIKWLDVDEKYQIAVEDGFRRDDQKQFEIANITIAIIYTPWRMPSFWRNTKEFRFITKKRSDGKIYWVPTPLNR